MKNFLFIAICFFAAQIIMSCATIEVEPGSTKLSIRNNSAEPLGSVSWNGIDFGNINKNSISERSFLDEKKINSEDYMTFEIKDSRYITVEKITSKKFRNAVFIFENDTKILDIDKPDACEGTVIKKPELTKISMLNESSIDLLQKVSWNGINFGDIEKGNKSERDISLWSAAYVHFEYNGIAYRTEAPFTGEKCKSNILRFLDETRLNAGISLGKLKDAQ